MTAAWPGSLPDDPFISGFREQSGDRLIRSRTDSGKPKRRPKFTAATDPIAFDLPMTRAQVATLKTFYETTLAGGALPFTFTHPRTQATETFYFAKPPAWQFEPGGKTLRVRLEFDLEP